MEEVDSIILHFLRQLNIKIDDDVKNICDLSVETIVESVSRCLTTINPTLKVAAKLPSGISHRIEVAAHIATTCKDLGYKNDVGYQTFLYYNEAELRKVFMFLIEKLPNEHKQTPVNTESTTKKSRLFQDIGRKIEEELNSIWIPPCCNPQKQQTIGDYYINAKPLVSLTLSEEEIVQRLLKMKDIDKSGSMALLSEEQREVTNEAPSKKPSNYDLSKSLKELKESTIILKQNLAMLESEKNIMDTEYAQVQRSCEKTEGDLKNIQNILQSLGVTDLNTDGVDNILVKVQNNIALLHRKSEELTSKNMTLKLDLEKLRSSMESSESERVKYKKILVNLKESAKSMKEEHEKKELQKDELKSNYAKFKGGNKRSIYTKRILEIISNVDKQNMEIAKILEDTRQLQKEISGLEGQLDRCFSIADETLFRDAKKDDQAKKAYKLLALLHSECNTIVSLVNDTGSLARDIIDLEDNIKAEKSKRTEDTLKKIQTDLATMHKELGACV